MAKVIDLVSSPEPSMTRAEPPKPATSSTTSKLSNAAQREIIHLLSDDDDDPPPPGKVSSKKSTTLATCKKSATGALMKATTSTGSTNPATTIAAASNEFYNEDDFDSTVNLDITLHHDDDDPFADDLPPLKKQRLSVSPKPAARISKGATFRRSKTARILMESDPLVFTSSPNPIAEAAQKRLKNRKENQEWNELPSSDDIFGFSTKPAVNATTAKGKGRAVSGLDPTDGDFSDSDGDLLDLDALRFAPLNKASKKASFTPNDSQKALAKYNAEKEKERVAKEKTNKAKEKTDKAKEKVAAKEAEKAQKEVGKKKKAHEKLLATELAKVNTLKTDKKVSVKEMIVQLPSCLNSVMLEQTYKFLDEREAQHVEWESDLPIVKWKRKVEAEYNKDRDQWEPIQPVTKLENTVMCVIRAQEVVDLVLGGAGQDLDAHVLKLKSKFQSCKIIYLIEGFMAWTRKNVNLKNRHFTAAVNSHLSQGDAPTASQRQKKKKKEPEYVDEDRIEDALLKLQVIHGIFIHHTNVAVETAEWILIFTQHISLIPYKYAPIPSSYLPIASANAFPGPRKTLSTQPSAWRQGRSKQAKTAQTPTYECSKKSSALPPL